MQFLTIVKPGPMPPPVDQIRRAQEWLRTRVDDGRFECAYAFPGGGGCGIGRADSLEELMDDLLEYPLSPFVEYEVKPLVDMDTAFEKYIAFAERMAEQMAAAQS
jgi:hypothetical protein